MIASFCRVDSKRHGVVHGNDVGGVEAHNE